MITFLIFSGVIALIVYRFQQEVQESYRYAGGVACTVCPLKISFSGRKNSNKRIARSVFILVNFKYRTH